MDSDWDLEGRLEAVHNRIEAAARRVRRLPTEVQLIAVTKTVPSERVAAAARLGVRLFGENRVEEAEAKFRAIEALVGPATFAATRWHLIGHLQGRKAARAVRLFDVIQTVDSVRLAQRLDRLVATREAPYPILLEVNASGEASKYGLPAGGWPDDQEQALALYREVEAILSCRRLTVAGLMTVAPLVTHPEAVRPVFRRLRELRDALARRWPGHSWQELSMGMSDDYEVAIEEGATMIRLGRAIFGPRA